MSDIAHLGPVELLTPEPQRSLEFFVDVLGMEIESERDRSIYLRGWGDYQRYSLQLTEHEHAGLAWIGLRARDPDALERRVRAVEQAGHGLGWRVDAYGRGRSFRCADPDGHVFELYSEVDRYQAPPRLRPALRNQPQRVTGRGASVKRLDHVNVLAADVRANRVFATDRLGYTLHERIELDDGTESGAWLSTSIAAHELIYTADAHLAHGRLHHLAFWVDTREECLRAADLFLEHGVPIEAAPSKHTISQGFFLYGIEPGGNRIEVTSGGYFVYDPEHEATVWTEAERARGQAWGVKTVGSFHTYGTPPVGEETPPGTPALTPERREQG